MSSSALVLPAALAARVHIVVMAGGSGTRFWPLSRRARPKQVLDLTGKGSLLANTFARVTDLAPPARHWLVVGAAHAEACRAAAPLVPPSQLLVEPRGRNTAPAIALATTHLAARDPDAIMVVLPADHHIADVPAFVGALGRAVELASAGPIVTLGIAADRPETGFGYIERGESDARVAGAFAVRRFVEKPDRPTAEQYLAAGRFDWNAGVFVMQARTFAAELERQLPDMAGSFAALGRKLGAEDYAAALDRVYGEVQSVSVDYGIMEKAQAVGVIPVACGWSDVGSLSAIAEVRDADGAGNVLRGRTVCLDSEDVIVEAGEDGHVVAVLGMRDTIVVHSRGATLVLPASRAQDVRKVVEALEARQWSDVL